jgi:hypothetical protein
LFRVDTFMADTVMNVDIYDTNALTGDGLRMHIEMLLPACCGARCDEKAANAARDWLTQHRHESRTDAAGTMPLLSFGSVASGGKHPAGNTGLFHSADARLSFQNP